jgi:carbohydrate esterase-like sialic acid-specific acetylesterase
MKSRRMVMDPTAFSAIAGAVLTLVACGGGGSGKDAQSGAGAAASGGAATGAAASNAGGGAASTADPNLFLFLLIGQSNMEGQAKPQADDRMTDARVKVLAYDNCPNLPRTYDGWYTATPPLHSCYAGVGPGDYFGKTLAAAYPDATIGLVPCAISGVDIDFFRKEVVSARRSEFKIPPDDHWGGAYEWVLERARLAQQVGVIRGIIFHQGESDTGQAVWVDKVKGMVTDLRADLGIGDVPFLAGELLYTGCCSTHNPIINQLPAQITNSFVVSAEGLTGQDDAHFDLAGQREFGVRYGNQMLEALR